jgi:hypothetical protein
MVIIFVILGFIGGITIGSGIVACALRDPLGAAYWSLVKRHSIGQRVRLCLVAFVAVCGVMFAYVGYSLI